MNLQKVLVVEDEPKLAQLLNDYLQQAGYEVSCVDDGNAVIERVKAFQPDAILLDLMLPGRDGLSLCKEIRTFSQVPILITTAKVEEIDRLLGLELGADDYICKPYSPREVIARLKAVLRRAVNTSTAQARGFILNEHSLQLSYQGCNLELTAVEFHLLKQLAQSPGRIFSRSQLMDVMYSDNRVVSDRTVDSHIKKLRKKIDEIFPKIEFIHSVYGAGYRFEIQP
jgi:two-component system response regulator BaeR